MRTALAEGCPIHGVIPEPILHFEGLLKTQHLPVPRVCEDAPRLFAIVLGVIGHIEACLIDDVFRVVAHPLEQFFQHTDADAYASTCLVGGTPATRQ